MEIALRKRNFDPMGVETVPYPEQHLVNDIGAPPLWVVNPDSELEVDRAVAEPRDQAVWLRIGQHALHVLR